LRTFCYVALLCFSLSLGANATAAVPRTFVSGSGSDSDPCTLLKPCRTFNRAISQTESGGEVVALDSAGYGTFTVNKAVPREGSSGISTPSGSGRTEHRPTSISLGYGHSGPDFNLMCSVGST